VDAREPVSRRARRRGDRARRRGRARRRDLPARLAGSGGELTSAELGRGKSVIVVWAGWSPRCRDIVERANRLDARWRNEARVVTVNFQEDPSAIEAFLRGKGLVPPVYLDRDGEFSKSLAVTSLPGLVVVRDGEVRYQGRLPADADAAIAEALR
jgi:thiol-disulfide isomerase/thioredoxin